MRQGKGLIWASVTHFIVDFICAWMIFSKIPGNGPWYLELLLYNFLAFAGQLPLGLLIDHLREKHKSISRGAASAGCAICLAVLVTGIDSWFLAAAAGIGNGLFHAGSGAHILCEYRNRSSAAGAFVSTGALGIFLGSVLPFQRIVYILTIFVTAVLILYSLRDISVKNEEPVCVKRERESHSFSIPDMLSVIFLFMVVALRSLEGSIFSFRWNDSVMTGLFIAAAVFAGKLLGGLAAGCFGRFRTSVTSLGTAAVFLVFSDQMTSALVGLLLFNMTMPVTLTALYDRFPGYPAASFGLLTFALYIGVLPVFAGVVSGISSVPVYVALTMLSLILLAAGLFLQYGMKKREEDV